MFLWYVEHLKTRRIETKGIIHCNNCIFPLGKHNLLLGGKNGNVCNGNLPSTYSLFRNVVNIPNPANLPLNKREICGQTKNCINWSHDECFSTVFLLSRWTDKL